MIQKLIEKLNKKRLKERISSAIVMVALIVSISGVVGAVSGIIVSNRYNYALKNYGFSQGDIGKMMITFADTRSYLRAAIGYQDENLVNSCAENYEKKKESCQQYTKEVKNTVSSSDEEKIYSSITEKLTEYYEICDAVLEKGKNTQDIDVRHEAQQMAQDQVAPVYEEIYQDMVKLMDADGCKYRAWRSVRKNSYDSRINYTYCDYCSYRTCNFCCTPDRQSTCTEHCESFRSAWRPF